MTGAASRASASRRGQPLLMLVVLLMVWTGGRVLLWESPLRLAETLSEFAAPQLASGEMGQALAHGNDEAGSVHHVVGASAFHLTEVSTIGSGSRDHEATQRISEGSSSMVWDNAAAPALSDTAAVSGGHQLLWMAAMAHLPIPRELEQGVAQVAQPTAPAPLAAGGDRWSVDAWSLWREGSGSALVSQGRVPTYGASQAGAVLRYRLAPRNSRDPHVYSRIYRALISGGESELAAGVSARPVADLPLRAHAEIRVTDYPQGRDVRPAAFVTSELPSVSLPAGLRAEAYFQGGYVGGDFATAFAEGQLHVLRCVADFDLGEISVGAAAWGGAQKDAERIDLGPSVRLDMRIAKTPTRLSVDYRERVAGDADPPSGVAVTLSTRF